MCQIQDKCGIYAQVHNFPCIKSCQLTQRPENDLKINTYGAKNKLGVVKPKFKFPER